MIIDQDAVTKIYIVMPFMDGMADTEGKPEFEWPHKDYCEVFFNRDKAEKCLLAKQKADIECTYIIMESILTCAKHETMNEYCAINTVCWF